MTFLGVTYFEYDCVDDLHLPTALSDPWLLPPRAPRRSCGRRVSAFGDRGARGGGRPHSAGHALARRASRSCGDARRDRALRVLHWARRAILRSAGRLLHGTLLPPLRVCHGVGLWTEGRSSLSLAPAATSAAAPAATRIAAFGPSASRAPTREPTRRSSLAGASSANGWRGCFPFTCSPTSQACPPSC